MRQILFFFMIIFLLAACSDDSPETRASEKYDTIDIEEVETYVADGYVLLDVREVDEYEEGHIPYAKNAPLSLLQTGDFLYLNKDEKYVIICRSGNRSQTASELLADQAFHVVNVSQGMSSWTGEIE